LTPGRTERMVGRTMSVREAALEKNFHYRPDEWTRL